MKLLKLILTAAGITLAVRTLFRLKRKADKVKSETSSQIRELEEEVQNPITRVENEGPTHINELTSVTPQVREVPAPTDIVDTNETTSTLSTDGLAQLRVEKKE